MRPFFRTSWLRVLLCASALAFFLGPSSCGGGQNCVDRDLDGFGDGCEEPDCDDTNPLRNDRCDLVPPPDCSADPLAPGCPCLPGSAECYPADISTLGVGFCQAGRTLCVEGFWNLCEGAITPRFETCEGTDQDCDGRVDEGVLSPCGACSPGCIGGVWGEGDSPFLDGDSTAVTDGGDLTLAREERITASVWVANSAGATVSKIDSDSAMEVARYPTGGLEPSRVAVDWLDDAWVVNREFDGVSTVRKIAGDLERCVDRDLSTTIETSTSSATVEDDECILFTVPFGSDRGVGRAIAIDGSVGPDGGAGGDAWIGLHDEEAIVHLSGTTGDVLERVDTPGFQPYAAVFDPWGTLWMISRDGFLLSMDRFVRPLEPVIREVPLACFLLYGLDADSSGNLLLTGFSCDSVTLYEPELDRWSTIDTPASVRGAVVVEDDIIDEEGRPVPLAWVAHTDGLASRIRMRPLQLIETVDLTELGTVPFETIGVGADDLGNFWAASSQGGGGRDGVVTRVDRATRAITAQVPVGAAPHTQGDLTGSKRAGGFLPEGVATHVFEGCIDGGTAWIRMHIAALVRGGGSVEVRARRADDVAGLASEAFVLLGTLPGEAGPYPLSFDPGGVVEVELTLRSEGRDGAPVVERVGLEWSCPGPD
ncbi:MAG: hypothetical protein AAGE52_20500 [Myxococcota bacterium]